jgi:hypothetical protein
MQDILKRRNEILDRIDELQSKTQLLFSGVPLGVGNLDKGCSWKQFKEAGDAQDEIFRLEDELLRLG